MLLRNLCGIILSVILLSVSLHVNAAAQKNNVLTAADEMNLKKQGNHDQAGHRDETVGSPLYLDDDLSFDSIGAIGEESAYQEKLLFGGNRQFIYQHDVSYVFSEPSEMATNRSSLRLRWNRVFNNLLNVHVDVKPVIYLGNDNYLDDDQNSIDSEFKVKEIYLQTSLGNTSITIGEKIVIWGESESAAVTDVISPQNLTDLVFTSLDESRISQKMIMVDHYMGQNQISLIINPDIKSDEDPPAGEILDGVEIVGTEYDDKNTEVGFRWKSAIGNGDFSIMLADLVDNQSVFKTIGSLTEPLRVSKFYKAYQMLGVAANLNYGDVALQLESAYNRDRARQAVYEKIIDATYEQGFIVSDEIKTSVTIKYQENGLRDWGFGVLNTHYFGRAQDFSTPERNLNELSFSMSNKFLHETLVLELRLRHEIETNANIQSISAIYAVTDNLNMNVDVFNLSGIGESNFNQKSWIARLIYSF